MRLFLYLYIPGISAIMGIRDDPSYGFSGNHLLYLSQTWPYYPSDLCPVPAEMPLHQLVLCCLDFAYLFALQLVPVQQASNVQTWDLASVETFCAGRTTGSPSPPPAGVSISNPQFL